MMGRSVRILVVFVALRIAAAVKKTPDENQLVTKRRPIWQQFIKTERAFSKPAAKQGSKSGNSTIWVVLLGGLVSAVLASLRQSIGSLLHRTKRVVEQKLWLQVELCEADDTRLFKAAIDWLHQRGVLHSGNFKAMSTSALERSKSSGSGSQHDPRNQYKIMFHGKNGSFPSAPSSLAQSDDVVMVPLTRQGVSASFRDGKGHTHWVMLLGPPQDESSSDRGLRAMVGSMRGGAQKRAAKAALRSGAPPAKLIISTLNREHAKPLEAIRELLRTALREADLADRKFVQVYELQPAPGNSIRFELSTLARKRPPSSLILKEGLMAAVLSDIQKFIDDEDWYTKRSLAHRRGYLLHGHPGNGKSSLVLSVASYFGWPLCLVALARLNTTPLSEAIAMAPPSSLIVIEDVDVAFELGATSRSHGGAIASAQTKNTMSNPISSSQQGASSSSSLQELLNALDGPGASDGRIIFLTTNRKDKLDKALIRPGRCDRSFCLGNADADMASRLFLTFYDDLIPQENDEIPALIPQENTTLTSQPDDDTTTAEIEANTSNISVDTNNETQPSLADLSARYGAAAGGHQYSMAALQGHLLLFKAEPIAAVLSAEQGYINDQPEELEDSTAGLGRLLLPTQEKTSATSNDEDF